MYNNWAIYESYTRLCGRKGNAKTWKNNASQFVKNPESFEFL